MTIRGTTLLTAASQQSVSLGLKFKSKAGNGATVLHYTNIYSSQSQLGNETAIFLLCRFAPTTGSLKPSEKKHNSVTVILYQLKIEVIVAR